jgi:hypothetical protein
MNDEVPFQDILGNTIKRGDFVAIAQRSGNSGSLTVAIVLDTLIDDSEYTNDYDRYKIRILGSYRSWKTGEFSVNSRHGDSYSDRVVVINESVPTDLQTALDVAYDKYWAKQ